MRVVGVQLSSADHAQALAEACLRFTPQIAVVGEKNIFLEISGTARLYSEQVLQTHLQELLQAVKVKARMAFGRSIPEVMAFVTYRCQRVEDLPMEALGLYASMGLNETLSPKTLETLRRLGVRSLRELLLLPRSSVNVRLGATLARTLDVFEHRLEMPWPRWEPRMSVIESIEISEDHRLMDVEPLMFHVKSLIDRAFMALLGQGKAPLRLRLDLRQESYSFVKETMRSIELAMTFPVRHPSALISLLREKMSQSLAKNTLQAPVVEIRLEIIEWASARQGQYSFFSKAEEESVACEAVINLLREKLGSASVYFAQVVESHWPENAWRKTLHVDREPILALPDRPLRLFQKPYALERTGDRWISRGKSWCIRSIEGPERILGEWWMQQDEVRDYFVAKVEGPRGAHCFWVFQHPGTDRYFLHGVFD